MPVFAKEDRVMVPGQSAEGVVMDVTETLPDYPVYTLRWLTASGEPQTATCGEGDLRASNPTDADLAAENESERQRKDAAVELIEAEVSRRLAIEVDDFKARQRQRAMRKPRQVIFKNSRARKKR